MNIVTIIIFILCAAYIGYNVVWPWVKSLITPPLTKMEVQAALLNSYLQTYDAHEWYKNKTQEEITQIGQDRLWAASKRLNEKIDKLHTETNVYSKEELESLQESFIKYEILDLSMDIVAITQILTINARNEQ